MADCAAGRTLFVAETGVLPAAARIARDAALLDAVGRDGTGPAPTPTPTLEFYRFHPAVLIGRHQWGETEIRRDYCIRHGIALARRMTGGEAFYVDEGQLAWSLVLPRAGGEAPGLGAILGKACRGVAAGLARLGVETRFSAPNAVEAAQGRVARCYARATEGAVLIQGTVLCAVDIGRMLHALRVPTEKLSPAGLAGARQRFVTLDDVLGDAPSLAAVRSAVRDGLAEAFGLSVSMANPGPAAAVAVPCSAGELGAAAPVGGDEAEAVWPCAGGALRARIRVAGEPPKIEKLVLAGDAMMDPPDLFERLATCLRGADAASWRARLAMLFAGEDIEIIGCSPRDIACVIARALARGAQRSAFGVSMTEANRLVVHGPADLDAGEIVRQATVMLVPYCAKAVGCKWRRRSGCPECGLCEVGEAYRIARERGMQAITITNYEHLVETLATLKRDGVTAFIGMCCSQFYLKRNRAFADAGIAAVLMDISGANCYELHQEEQAYAGAFEAKAELDIALLDKVTAVKRG
jgi:lipoate-protein ligase A